jgi:predicted nucleotidyltransferase
MTNLDDIKAKLGEALPEFREKYKVKALEIFGSYVRGEAREGSDLDVLVEFTGTIDLFSYVGLQNHLSERLGMKVDLVMKDALKPRIRERILQEAVPV